MVVFDQELYVSLEIDKSNKSSLSYVTVFNKEKT